MRICTECKEVMLEGYCIEAGAYHFCEDECLHKHYSEAEYLTLYDNGDGDTYWTAWHDEPLEDLPYSDTECIQAIKLTLKNHYQNYYPSLEPTRLVDWHAILTDAQSI